MIQERSFEGEWIHRRLRTRISASGSERILKIKDSVRIQRRIGYTRYADASACAVTGFKKYETDKRVFILQTHSLIHFNLIKRITPLTRCALFSVDPDIPGLSVDGIECIGITISISCNRQGMPCLSIL